MSAPAEQIQHAAISTPQVAAAGSHRCAHHRHRVIPIIAHEARATASSQQGLLLVRYSLAIRILALAAFTLAFVGWLNESRLFLFDNPIWLNRYTEYAIILGFGVWRIVAEQNRYTRFRLTRK